MYSAFHITQSDEDNTKMAKLELDFVFLGHDSGIPTPPLV
jgi:hypothetical protein